MICFDHYLRVGLVKCFSSHLSYCVASFIHAVRFRFLIEVGADIGARTRFGETALYWARRALKNSNHPVIRYLEDIGAPDYVPDL